MFLVNNLNKSQIRIAKRLHDQMPRWVITNKSLDILCRKFPKFDEKSTLIKAVVINSLFGTNVFAIERMSEHIKKVIERTDLRSAGPELVEAIALLPKTKGQMKSRQYISFASKFSHFFINNKRFPILDSYAKIMLRYHLGRANFIENKKHQYTAFVENFNKLRELAYLDVSTRELDHYLWIAGLYRAWKKNPKKRINVDARSLFENPSPIAAVYLDKFFL